eukprot:TRINITY_DN8449_c0_g1_i1.p1 TRINITY_DN8449_c0_g1~~TRINITY_DN8449_c0_g1_i1.p1  ORF type:complete len:304 (+),score=60.55 TRINITY_DN8449_c0_g1_i1:73-984(+)
MRLLKQSTTLCGHSEAISSVQFSDDGNYLASASNDKTVCLWDVNEGRSISKLTGHTQGISDIAWVDDSKLVATASDDCTVRLYDRHNSDLVHTFEGHTNYVMCVDYNPSKNLLASGSFDKTVRIWDVSGRRCVHRIPAHSDTVVSSNFDSEGKRLVTGGFDGFVRVWDVDTGACVESYLVSDANTPVTFAQWSPNGRYILVGCFDSTWKLLNTATGKIAKTYTGHVLNDYCIFASFYLPTGRNIFSGSADNSVCVWDINTKEMVQKLEGHEDVVVAVASHPTQDIIASGSIGCDNTVRIWSGE